uniref:NADPH-dependent pterin aldehyde reductase isoform X2 n=1 Tax=Erigeron canadensis TaxID=72917 RepID=UPI001CB969C7|nr:NADPH-dependent pterin aldehyde reductase isoform X2 [Erigeron canadensis]
MMTATVNAVVNGGGGVGQKKTVLITGVSRGLGKALALEIAKRGHSVIGCSRSQDKLNSLQSQLISSSSDNDENQNHKHLFLNVDVCSNSSVEELAKVVMEKKGVPPDIIVNNAGTINKNNRLWEVPEEEFNAVIDTNLKGVANMLRHFIPLMIERKQGILVNMSSGWGRSAAAQVAPYCASKWAVEGLSKSVAKELPSGMAIVALNPGVINTDMLASCFGSSSSLYQTPDSWAPKAADMILNLTTADNGASLSV